MSYWKNEGIWFGMEEDASALDRRAQLLAAGRRLRATLTGLSREAAISTVESSSLGAYSDEPSIGQEDDIQRYFTGGGDSSTKRASIASQLDDTTPDDLSVAEEGSAWSPNSPPLSPPDRRVSVPRIPITGLPGNQRQLAERTRASSSVACQCCPSLAVHSTVELLRSEITAMMDQRLSRLEQPLAEQLALQMERIEQRLSSVEEDLAKLQPALGDEMKPGVWRIVDIWQNSKHAS